MQSTNPYTLFETWYEEAKQSEMSDPNAMSLATLNIDQIPNVRIVLMKEWDERGFVFYTNLESAKGQEITNHELVGVVFHWKSLKRQIRFQGRTEFVSNEQSDAYFASRPRNSQLGARISMQSRELESREVFNKAFEKEAAKYPEGTAIPRPEHWGGIRIIPENFEFWQDQVYRLHDRLAFFRDMEGHWQTKRLYP